jgi:hypothetical protein
MPPEQRVPDPSLADPTKPMLLATVKRGEL